MYGARDGYLAPQPPTRLAGRALYPGAVWQAGTLPLAPHRHSVQGGAAGLAESRRRVVPDLPALNSARNNRCPFRTKAASDEYNERGIGRVEQARRQGLVRA
ncbi:hypothetical protein Pta02_13600 [Planobispora takensis]|uniref:Uncharacterized protein n=1 Tax=Planobispora takensis TaxID=1367882 RepID=A0A8J3SUP4_9ACTN|nr:hypothetical protein Pta02_13600 [Planobispora takensis]